MSDEALVLAAQVAVLWRKCHKPEKSPEPVGGGFTSNREHAILPSGRRLR